MLTGLENNQLQYTVAFGCFTTRNPLKESTSRERGIYGKRPDIRQFRTQFSVTN